MKQLVKKLVPSFLIDWYHFLITFGGAVFFGFPSRRIKVIGVTGTNGKSTVVELITKIFEEADHKVAALSSIKFKIGKEERPNELRMTMPGRALIQKFLRQAVQAGCQYAILEITSEGIKQHRHCFINFETAVFTNLSPEHIEAHSGFENYRAAKGEFFKAVKNIHIINIDDENAEYFLKFPAKVKYQYGLKYITRPDSQLPITDCYSGLNGLSFQVEETGFNLSLLGLFNIYNALAAICAGLSEGIDLKICQRALAKAEGVPGRMELVISEPFRVFVDYAFTPNALQKVYETLSGNSKQIPSSKSQKSKLICVLGAAGGGRDKWKRPILGKLASQYCDEVIVTNEDPYDENPSQILSEIKSGIPNDKIPMTNLILDRRKAIRKALEDARPGDVVIITGKGCEPSICVAGGKKIPWDDRKVVREEFLKLIPK